MMIQLFYTTGVVVGGGAVFQGKAGLALIAVSLLIVFATVVGWIRSRNETIAVAKMES